VKVLSQPADDGQRGGNDRGRHRKAVLDPRGVLKELSGRNGGDEKRLHTLFLDKEVREIGAIQAISRVNRTTKHKHDCKIVDFSYNNVNVQNIKDAFEHFSDVVVSDFDPFGDKRILEEVLYGDLKKLIMT
jgi:hypothetical protein